MEQKREAIIEFMKKKRDFIREETGLDIYFTRADEEELKSWSSERILKVYEHFDEFLDSEEVTPNDCDLCPWCVVCILYHQRCTDCEYGERHGKCGEKYCRDDYSKLLDALEESDGLIAHFGVETFKDLWAKAKESTL